MSAEEADDWHSEHGYRTPAQVHADEAEDRAEAACAAGRHDWDHGRCIWCGKCEPEAEVQGGNPAAKEDVMTDTNKEEDQASKGPWPDPPPPPPPGGRAVEPTEEETSAADPEQDAASRAGAGSVPRAESEQ